MVRLKDGSESHTKTARLIGSEQASAELHTNQLLIQDEIIEHNAQDILTVNTKT